MSDTSTSTKPQPKSEEQPEEKATDEKPADEKPADEPKAVDEKPVDEKPVDEKKADEEPAGNEEPVANESDPAEAGQTSDEPVDGDIDTQPTSEPPPPDIPEAELPEGFEEEAAADHTIGPDDDPADYLDQPTPTELADREGGERPEAHDFTPTDGVPDMVDPYDSVDTTNPWDSASDGADAQWGQDSLTDLSVSWEPMGDWNVYQDNSNGNTYTDYGDGTFEANVGGQILTGDAAASAFQQFTDSRLMDEEKLERLQRHAYDDAPAGAATGATSSAPPGTDVGNGDASTDEQMGPPSELAGGGGDGRDADANGDGEVTLGEKILNALGRLTDGPASQEARRIDREMGGSGKADSTRGEQDTGAREELDRQEKENAKAAQEKADKEEAEKEKAEESGDGDAKDLDHPGWGDGNRGGVSIFDPLRNTPGQRDPRDPGNIDPADEGYGDGGGDATSSSSDDLKQPAGPDVEPSGGGGRQPAPEPIDYGPDHVDPIGSGPYDDDPFDMGPGTVSLPQDDESEHTEPIEMADDGIPDFEVVDFGG